MAQEEAHAFVNGVIGNQVIIVNHQQQGTMPIRQLNKELRKQR